jgi:hypothetical protein
MVNVANYSDLTKGVIFMENIKNIEKEDLKNVERLKQRELVIVPTKDFINWYKSTRNQNQEIKMKRKEVGSDFMECPNCRETMEDCYVKEPSEQELWHLCPYCNLTFSHRQYNRFTDIITSAIHRKSKTVNILEGDLDV